ncbi:hypothetical protein S83_061844 [Arachis hypogaea]
MQLFPASSCGGETPMLDDPQREPRPKSQGGSIHFPNVKDVPDERRPRGRCLAYCSFELDCASHVLEARDVREHVCERY